MPISDKFRDPVRNVNKEFLAGLETVSNKIYPLPGATFRRGIDIDPRLSKLHAMAGTPLKDEITYYEHIATVRNRVDNRYFIAFRQTMDALLIDFKDPTKYPEWLIKSDIKKAELKTHIYAVKMFNGQPVLPRNLTIIRTHEDYLEHIGQDWVFDTIAYFLMTNKVITLDMYTRMK
jgi:hypothetical protein